METNSSNTNDSKTSKQPRPYQQSYQKKRVFYYRKKVCRICQMYSGSDSINIDYKNIGLLRKFVTEKGKIIPRRLNGTCAKHQRLITREIKKARTVALLPFTQSY